MAETDLFEPVSLYLESHGYNVDAEVQNCDVVATKDDDLIIIELKTSISIKLLIQATRRQTISSNVYVAIPEPKTRQRFNDIKNLLKRLELGLLVISEGILGLRVIKALDPLPFTKQKNKKKQYTLIKEIDGRSKNYNIGGSVRSKLVTAYRENAVYIAICLQDLGPSSPKLIRTLGGGEKTQAILSKNYYGWFCKIKRGLYKTTSEGNAALKLYPELSERSRQLLKERRIELASAIEDANSIDHSNSVACETISNSVLLAKNLIV